MLLEKIKRKLRNTFKKKTIPAQNEKKWALMNFVRENKGLRVLVETGTFLGETVEHFKSKFEQIYSIELAEELAKKATVKFQNDKNVKIVQGDSGVLLKSIIKEISEPALFWLDGHYSSEFFVGDEFIKTARTDKDTPIEEELSTILSSPLNHVILIDDARLFDGTGDYPAINSIRKKVKLSKVQYDFFVKEDIIHIIPIS